MAFRDVSYFVRPSGDKKELQLLDKVSGVFRPGVLTSLMGASGAGKTTLMDVLAGRKTGGRVEGLQLVDGAPKRQAAFTRLMGYVEELDVHNPQATVEEALLFSARLRVSSELLPAANAKAFVRHMMEVVELGPLAHRLIGWGGPSGGLSTEARKRLTIAVELVANPSIVFMDEPTTGLDARAAGLVMRAVRNTVATGRTVVCTIHQPNRDIMDNFDELLLLKPGGRTIFFGALGEKQTSLVSYLSSISGVGRYEPHMNPAEWMLEVTSPAAEAGLGLDFAQVWEASQQARAANQLIEEHCGGYSSATAANRGGCDGGGNAAASKRPAAAAAAAAAGNGGKVAAADGDVEAGGGGGGALKGNQDFEVDKVGGNEAANETRRYAQLTHVQLWLVLHRALVSHCRNTTYNGMRFTIAFALAWILGSLYWGRGMKRNSIVGLMDIMGAIFSGVLFLPMTNLMMVMPQVMAERAVFYREKASGMYRPAVFAAAQGLAEMPFVFLESILYVVIMYCTIHFEFTSEKALWFWLYIWFALMICTFMGMGFMSMTPNMPAAIASGSALVLLWNLFCGFLIYRKDIKPWYLWAYYGNPITYIIYGCVTTQMGDVWDEHVDLGNGAAMPVAAYVRDTFNYEYSMRGWIVLILIGFMAVFRAATYLGITRFSYQSR
ncbi:hypothetical protein Vretifemale_19890 [Volvox reticuliferus]|nr:hypothetical protein Vretifemale_19890 [Volvox reticuliferus]